jgi:hypothetical protein
VPEANWVPLQIRTLRHGLADRLVPIHLDRSQRCSFLLLSAGS